MVSVKPSHGSREQNVPDSGAAATTLRIGIAGMNCASCVGRLEKPLRGIEHVESANVDLAAERAQILFSATPDPAAIQTAVERSSYAVVDDTLGLVVEVSAVRLG